MKKENTPTLFTNRLCLRKVTASDFDALYDVFNDDVVNYFLPWFTLKSRNDCRLFIKERFLDYYQAACAYRYAICLKDSNVAIGYIVYDTTDSHDMGYGLARKYWGQGILHEAASALLNQIKNAGYPFVSATHDIENSRSAAVLKRLGLQYCYSYIEMWQPKNKWVTFRLYQINFDENASVYTGYWEIYAQHFIEDID